MNFSQTSLHAKVVDTVRFLLSWHDGDPRYSSPDAKQRVAALYLPLLSIAMDVLPILHYFSSDKTQYTNNDDLAPSNINQTVAMAIAGKLPPSTCDTFPSVINLNIFLFNIRNRLVAKVDCGRTMQLM